MRKTIIFLFVIFANNCWLLPAVPPVLKDPTYGNISTGYDGTEQYQEYPQTLPANDLTVRRFYCAVDEEICMEIDANWKLSNVSIQNANYFMTRNCATPFVYYKADKLGAYITLSTTYYQIQDFMSGTTYIEGIGWIDAEKDKEKIKQNCIGVASFIIEFDYDYRQACEVYFYDPDTLKINLGNF